MAEAMGEMPDALSLMELVNIADIIDEDTLTTIGQKVCEWVSADTESRAEWKEQQQEWIDLATQVMEEKSFPWPNASNVKYPLLATACMQFHARAFPTIMNNDSPVRAKPIGRDPQNTKKDRALRVQEYMSYQVLHDMEYWQDDMDRMFLILPMVGEIYKKTFYSQKEQKTVSKLVSAHEFEINYDATCFKNARKTHRMLISPNEMTEYMRLGIFRSVDLSPPSDLMEDKDIYHNTQDVNPIRVEGDLPYEVYETHYFWDLDDDGYAEPYILTVESESKQVLRIVARWDADSIVNNAEGEIALIDPIEYFTPYYFLPDPNSAVSGIGFGSLLGPLNDAANTILNQLIDAGTLNNLQSGFLGRGWKVRGGTIRFSPGEWIQAPVASDDLRKSIFPLPVKEPSTVLFSLLGMLLESGEKLGSIGDIMTGMSPGQNQPYMTSAMVLEQGLKVFASIYKRVYRSLGKEFKSIYRLNRNFLDIEKYTKYFDIEEQITLDQDFEDESIDILPGADPNIMTEMQKIMRAQSLEQKLMAGFPLNPEEVLRRSLFAEGHEDIEGLMSMPPAQPPMEEVRKDQELRHRMEYDWAKLEYDALRTQFEALKDKAQAISLLAKAEATTTETDLSKYRAEVDTLLQQEQQVTQRMKVLADIAKVQKEGQNGTTETTGDATSEGP